jgi:hypothetical protein
MKVKIVKWKNSLNEISIKLKTKKLNDLMTFSDIFRIYASKDIFPLIRFYPSGRQIDVSKGVGRETIITKHEN